MKGEGAALCRIRELLRQPRGWTAAELVVATGYAAGTVGRTIDTLGPRWREEARRGVGRRPRRYWLVHEEHEAR